MLKPEERQLLEDIAVLITDMGNVKVAGSSWAFQDQEERKIQITAIENMRREFYSTLVEYNRLAKEKGESDVSDNE
jgi:hypothetical protein